MKLIKMHVEDAWAKIWFGILIWKGKSITSISAHEHLTFVKHIYVDMNADVITVRPMFAQQEWVGLVGAAEVGPSNYSSRIYSLF
jgi:hypothetical protein